ncbi:hypothetical protein DRN94_003745 [archaeon]|nr:hypothetical protein [archaeon]
MQGSRRSRAPFTVDERFPRRWGSMDPAERLAYALAALSKLKKKAPYPMNELVQYAIKACANLVRFEERVEAQARWRALVRVRRELAGRRVSARTRQRLFKRFYKEERTAAVARLGRATRNYVRKAITHMARYFHLLSVYSLEGVDVADFVRVEVISTTTGAAYRVRIYDTVRARRGLLPRSVLQYSDPVAATDLRVLAVWSQRLRILPLKHSDSSLIIFAGLLRYPGFRNGLFVLRQLQRKQKEWVRFTDIYRRIPHRNPMSMKAAFDFLRDSELGQRILAWGPRNSYKVNEEEVARLEREIVVRAVADWIRLWASIHGIDPDSPSVPVRVRVGDLRRFITELFPISQASIDTMLDRALRVLDVYDFEAETTPTALIAAHPYRSHLVNIAPEVPDLYSGLFNDRWRTIAVFRHAIPNLWKDSQLDVVRIDEGTRVTLSG